MDNTTPAVLAKYMVGKYRLGHIRLAAYLAAVLFEHIIDSKLPQPATGMRIRTEQETLWDRIRSLQDLAIRKHHPYTLNNIFQLDIRTANCLKARAKLQKFNKSRNTIVHNVSPEKVGVF